MTLRFEQVMPLPLQEIASPNTQIWDCDFALEPGKKYLLAADSGRGKSTFLSIIYGLRRDYMGKVYLEDKLGREMTLSQWSELRATKLSMVFQDLRLFPKLTVGENLILKAKLYGKVDLFHLKNACEDLGILHHWDRPTGKLSFGERQRVAIIRALLQPFEWLLLDEPFSHLDLTNRQKAVAMIQTAVASQGAGLILSALDDTSAFDFDQSFRV